MDTWWKRIREELDRKGWSIVEFERRTGIDRGRLYKYVTGEVAQPRGDAFARMADALGVEEWWLRSGQGIRSVTVPVVGQVLAGESWEAIPEPHQVNTTFNIGSGSNELFALDVVGFSMAPAYRHGDVVICYRRYRNGLDTLDLTTLHRVDCAVRTRGGQGYLKFVVSGRGPGLFTLRSYNPHYPDVENVELEWIAPVVWIRRNRGLDRS